MTDDPDWTAPTLAKAARLLRAAHDLYVVRSQATVGWLVRDKHGHRLPMAQINSARAARWSPAGALLHGAWTEFEVETVVIPAPPGSGLDLDGPKYVLASVSLLFDELVCVYREKTSQQTARPDVDAHNPFAELLDRATLSAREYWLSEFITWLPEVTRRDGANALAAAAQTAEERARELRRQQRLRGSRE